MVFYSEQADRDLDDMLESLLSWTKVVLTSDFCHQYMSGIIDVCDELDKKTVHFNATYESHRYFGSKVHSYKRNYNTMWYIIYDVDRFGNIYINKILNNYLTTK